MKNKCPYCSSEYHISNDGPWIELMIIKDQQWDAKIITKMHDIRQDYKCDNCGASFKFETKKSEKAEKNYRTIGTGPC